MKENYEKIASILLKNGIGILPTDTLYGLVGRALSRKAFERIFKLKKRNQNSPFIILISSIKDLELFNIKIDKNTEDILHKYWHTSAKASADNKFLADKSADKPGKVSIILPCDNEKFSYLHLGTKTLAFRIPDKKDLLELLEKTGPLMAPSANPNREKPALTTEEAKEYFGNSADFYIDEGKMESLPSTLIKIKEGKIEVLREGAVKING